MEYKILGDYFLQLYRLKIGFLHSYQAQLFKFRFYIQKRIPNNIYFFKKNRENRKKKIKFVQLFV